MDDASRRRRCSAITPADNARDIDMFVFSPDGKTIAYISADEKSVMKTRKKEENNEPDPEVWGEKWEHARLRLVDVESKKRRILVGGDARPRQHEEPPGQCALGGQRRRGGVSPSWRASYPAHADSARRQGRPLSVFSGRGLPLRAEGPWPAVRVCGVSWRGTFHRAAEVLA